MMKFFKNRKNKKDAKIENTAKDGGAPETEPTDDERMTEFYQAVISRFVTLLDGWADDNPDVPDFREHWTFKLEDFEHYKTDNEKARMSCRIIAHSLSELYPPLAEFAHGFGDTMSEAVDMGFNNWITTDLPILIDLPHEKPVLCGGVSTEDKNTGVTVKGLLGPMQFWSHGGNDPQPCCNSCVFTQALQADNDLMFGEKPMLIKAVVARNPDNTTQSDFRINGVQNDEIASALCAWAESWDGDGFAMRKQALIFV